MNPAPNDAEVEAIVLRSRLIRAARDLLTAADRVCARSRTIAILARRWTARDLAVVLAIASVVHGVIVSFEPLASAPFGRYLLAGLGLAAAAIAAAAARFGEDDVRNLR